MKRLKKRLAVLIAAVIGLSVLLTGCQSKSASADQTVNALFDLVMKENAAPMKDLLGFASEDDVRSSLLAKDYVGSFDTLKGELEGSGVDFTEDQTKAINDALNGLMDKMTCTTEIQSKTNDKATVLLKMNGYSSEALDQVETDVLEDMEANMDPEVLKAIQAGDQEAAEKMMSDVMNQYIIKIGEIEPSTETTEITVKCEKQRVNVSGKDKIEWMPSDLDKFVSDIDNASFK